MLTDMKYATGRYVRDEAGEPRLEPDLIAWAKVFHDPRRIVAQTDLGTIRVSTVFLGLDHSFGFGGGEPVLWETMIFSGTQNDYQERYTSRADAVAGHARAVDLVMNDP